MSIKTMTIICGVMIAVATTGAAQTQEKHKPATPFPLDQAISVDFQDIPLRSAIEFIADHTGVTMIAEPILDKSTLTIKADHVPLRQMLSIMENVLQGISIQISVGTGFVSLDQVQGLPSSELVEAMGYKPGTKVVVLFKRTIPDQGDPFGDGATSPKAETRTIIYNLSLMHKEGSRKTEDVATALQTAWEMMSEDEKPQMTFHEETSLLMCKGTDEAIQIADQIMGQMPEGEHIVMQSILFRQNTESPEFLTRLADILEKREQSSSEAMKRRYLAEVEESHRSFDSRMNEMARQNDRISDQKQEIEKRADHLTAQLVRLEAELAEALRKRAPQKKEE